MPTRPNGRRVGFTLIEMLVVITIIGIISASVIAVVLPALGQQQVSGSARILQAKLASSRDSAMQANTPRGIRLLPDPLVPPVGGVLAANRIIDIQAAPDYSEGVVDFGGNVPAPDPNAGFLWVYGPTGTGGAGSLPLAPTSWYWNIRKGERIRFADAGPIYTIVGPMGPAGGPPTTPNPEGFINEGLPGTPIGLSYAYNSMIDTTWGMPEVLFLVSGRDDNANGYIDDGADGLDNNGNDPGNGSLIDVPNDPFEQEFEKRLAAMRPNTAYTILRRPVPVPGSTETALLQGVEIDLTTFNSSMERSRLPVDPVTGFVDILMGPDGSVIQASSYSGASGSSPRVPFYHFWLTERRDVHEPRPPTGSATNVLPMPRNPPVYDEGERSLKGQRRLITLNTRTGMVTTNSIEVFDPTNTSLPFIQAQRGVREPQ